MRWALRTHLPLVLAAQLLAPLTLAAEPDETTEAQASFDILEYRVLGNTTLAVERIERAVSPFLGQGKTLDDVQSAREQLERAYRDVGYGTVFVDIPEQKVDGGIVRLRVTEGRLDRVRITGARYFSNGRIRRSLPSLASGSVPKLPALQEELTALNSATRDRAVVPVLKAGLTPGTVDVELKVNDTLPLHGNLEVNDRYTANTSELRVNASISYDNLFQRQGSFSLQYQVAPQQPSETRAIVASFAFRPDAWKDTSIAAYAVDSSTDVAALGTLSVLGNGRIYGLRATHALPESPGYLHSVTFGVDYKDFLENIRLADDQELVTPVRYLNWSVTYSGTNQSERATDSANLAANFGVRGVVNRASDFADKRYKAIPNYFYLRGAVQHLQQLPFDLQIAGRLSGQVTSSPLVSNEQFALGGADTVRAYLESSELGDYGLNASVELRNAWLARSLQLHPGAAYFLMFVDSGVLGVRDPLPSQAAHFELASWGVGLRVAGWHGFDLAIDWAQALRDAGTTKRGDDRAHFSLRYGF